MSEIKSRFLWNLTKHSQPQTPKLKFMRSEKIFNRQIDWYKI